MSEANLMNCPVCRVVPIPGLPSDDDLLSDCEIATKVLQRIVENTPAIFPSDAYALLQERMAKVCVLPWDRMKLELG